MQQHDSLRDALTWADRALQWLGGVFVNEQYFERSSPLFTEVADDGALFESGEPLVRRIYDAILLRRSVLVTGPRGSGKTYCAKKAIERAEAAGIIAGHHFLQGNREIPRDYLSEDLLTIEPEKTSDGGSKPVPRLRDAMVVRFPEVPEAERKDARHRNRWDRQVAAREKGKERYFPGVSKLKDKSEHETWKTDDWIVLFLDEINRFGDGFLDSLLSLTEERIVVHGGDKLHVPIIVVATANPPGYDVTAKKLSPPLQARISRSYRVSQPAHEALSYIMLPDFVRRYNLSYWQAAGCPMLPPEPSSTTESKPKRDTSRDVEVSPRIRRLVSGAALALWGLPALERKGIGFLAPRTRALLARAAGASQAFAADLRVLGELVTFGPDARSVGDWVGGAMGLALEAQKGSAATGATPSKVEVTEQQLLACAAETLAHKVRENFNEGAEPLKVLQKEELILRIVRAVFEDPHVRTVFDPPIEEAVKRLVGADLEAIVAPAEDAETEPVDVELALAFVDVLADPRSRGLTDALGTQETFEKFLASTHLAASTLSLKEAIDLDELAARLQSWQKLQSQKLRSTTAASSKKAPVFAGITITHEKLATRSVVAREHLLQLVGDFPILDEWHAVLDAVLKNHRGPIANFGDFRVWSASVLAACSVLRPTGVEATTIEQLSPALGHYMREQRDQQAASLRPALQAELSHTDSNRLQRELTRFLGNSQVTPSLVSVVENTLFEMAREAHADVAAQLRSSARTIAERLKEKVSPSAVDQSRA